MDNPNFNTILSEALKKLKRITNADSIRAMTDEELAEWIANLHCPHYEDGNYTCDDCEECWLDWLREEARGKNENA